MARAPHSAIVCLGGDVGFVSYWQRLGLVWFGLSFMVLSVSDSVRTRINEPWTGQSKISPWKLGEKHIKNLLCKTKRKNTDPTTVGEATPTP